MTLRLLPLLLLLAAAPAGAQSVADYYHTAAQAYIDGQNAEAEQAALAGLDIDPTDAKLQALLEKIREHNPDDSGGEQKQESADEQQDGEGEQQDAQSGEQDPEAEQEGQEEQTQQPEGEQQQPEEPSEPQDQQQGDAGAEGEQPPQTPQGGGTQSAPFEVKPGEMSQTEAERILRAIESDELELLRDVQRRRARPRFVEKDW